MSEEAKVDEAGKEAGTDDGKKDAEGVEPKAEEKETAADADTFKEPKTEAPIATEKEAAEPAGEPDKKDGGDGDPLVIDENEAAKTEECNGKDGEAKPSASAAADNEAEDGVKKPTGSAGATDAADGASNKDDEEEEEKEFEPTIDMMMNDFDDERTMEEEEALEGETEENTAAEVAALEEEGDMPLEDLIKMYYGGAPKDEAGSAPPPPEKKDDEGADGDGEDNEDEEAVAASSARPSLIQSGKKGDGGEEDDSAKVNKPTLIPKAGEKRALETPVAASAASPEGASAKQRGSMSPPPPAKKSKSELARFYEATVEGRSLRSSAPAGSQPEEEDEDSDAAEGGAAGDSSDHEGRDYSWKKTIMIGPSYQASVPSGMAEYEGDALPYENEDKLLWDPNALQFNDVEEYLSKTQESLQQASGGVASIPLGAHVRDDEQALHLLHQCGNNYEEALRRRRVNSVPPADTMTLWSEEECRAFELGLRLYGKDFHMIQQQKVRTRSVGELVQFYYLWKKTERHDVFANATRLEKKKYTLHPGTTDYMDRFIEEQDPSRDRSSSPNYHSLLYGSDSKKSQSPTLGASSRSDKAENQNGDSSTAANSSRPEDDPSANGAVSDTVQSTNPSAVSTQ